MKMNGIDVPLLKQWVGRTQVCDDSTHPDRVNALAAVLDRKDIPKPEEGVPPLWHWIYFWTVAAQSELDDDGHPRRGGFLPPVPLPRRMWAGGRLTFLKPLQIGATVKRKSTIKAVEVKRGKSGDMVFVTVEHAIFDEGGIALIEEHDIVYRDAPQKDSQPVQAKLAPSSSEWSDIVRPDPLLLFRYSALTFNGHRIHYDRSYVTEVEAYPGLIVHGPLIATLLVELLHRKMPGVHLNTFSFRAVSPLFDIEQFEICGQPDADGTTVQLWARNARGELAMQAEATIAA
ncbi:FAS1-like dehydratase domain-containing protein [Noviherbaspirillum saxi]|uniref:Acyl-CoA dehydrogenase n=1 Tax=Noviherbaspirillum saxi TaxID=2320863 RepID=A0A3A3FSI5_9BURK|nr:MaoC family dehydratase N-terminal domain-containing protein [Noviherbaspirillum saxi]RJF98224.1 acyl-CoA dehydrogenase [Noviherbaspirillum saxi]